MFYDIDDIIIIILELVPPIIIQVLCFALLTILLVAVVSKYFSMYERKYLTGGGFLFTGDSLE